MTTLPPRGEDALGARLRRLRLAKRDEGWERELLGLALELTMARAGGVFARSVQGWRTLASTLDDDRRDLWNSLAEDALARGIGTAGPLGSGDRWGFAARLGPASVGEPDRDTAVLVLEVASTLEIDLVLTRERIAFLAAICESAVTEANLASGTPFVVAARAAEILRDTPDMAAGLHRVAAFLARAAMPQAERVAVCRTAPVAIGVSDQSVLEHRSDLARHFLSIAREAANRGSPHMSAADGPSTPAEGGFRDRFGRKGVMSIPSKDGTLVLIAVYPSDVAIDGEKTKILAPIANALGGIAMRPARNRRLRLRVLTPALVAAGIALLGLLPRAAVVEAPFALRPEHMRVVTAPFDGILEGSEVQPGDQVVGTRTVLARLATRDIELELDAARARATSDRRDAAIARAGEQSSREQISLLSARRTEAQISLLEYRLRLAEIRAPADGTIVSGDLRKSVGQPLARGQVLFEISLPGALRVEILVLDEDITAIAVGQGVVFSTAAEPGVRRSATVERIRPMAEVVGGRNVFRVYARLDHPQAEDLRPGMEGWAKIDVGQTTWLGALLRDPLRWVGRHLWL